MTLYAWIAIALSTWFGIGTLSGLLLARLIGFGVGDDIRVATPAATEQAADAFVSLSVHRRVPVQLLAERR